jgi:hypothetical protein
MALVALMVLEPGHMSGTCQVQFSLEKWKNYPFLDHFMVF